MSTETKPYPGTQSVIRAVALLKCFDEESPEWRLAELSRELGLNKTTVFRLLSALESEGLIARASSGEGYVLGTEIVRLAGHALRSNDLHSLARAELEKLASTTGETASLEILSDGEMLIIDEVAGGHLVSGMRSLGTRWPLHGSSTGLAILAAWPANKRESYLNQDLRPITPRTITDSHVLRAFLDDFAVQGYAVSDEMLELGLVAIGAPIVNFEGCVEAAVSVYGPKSRLDAKQFEVIGALVRESAAAISAKLGYRLSQATDGSN